MLRRVAFIKAGRRLGLSLSEIKVALDRLPAGKAPTRAEWSRAAKMWQARIRAQIADLERLSSTLRSCIGCGCLSLRACALYNAADEAGSHGPGARWPLEDDWRPAGAGLARRAAR